MRHIEIISLLLLSACSRPEPTRTSAIVAPPAVTHAPQSNAAPPTKAMPPAPSEPSAVPLTPVASSDPIRMPTEWRADYSMSGSARVAHAAAARGDVIRELFEKANVAFPPKDVLIRVYKLERELEVWAGDGASELSKLATYGICAASGELGPKRREGDRQVPEGFYKVGYFHPESAYYLAAYVDYPNRSDKQRGGPNPGGQILIHGACASIGCVSMTDERIEEIYTVMWSANRNGGRTHVHIAPARDFDALLADPARAEHSDFWKEIRVGFDAFDRTKRIPDITIDASGAYVVSLVKSERAAP